MWSFQLRARVPSLWEESVCFRYSCLNWKSSMQALVPRTAGLELRPRQFEPWRVSVDQNTGLPPAVPVKTLGIGERIMPRAGEKQRGLRP